VRRRPVPLKLGAVKKHVQDWRRTSPRWLLPDLTLNQRPWRLWTGGRPRIRYLMDAQLRRVIDEQVRADLVQGALVMAITLRGASGQGRVPLRSGTLSGVTSVRSASAREVGDQEPQRYDTEHLAGDITRAALVPRVLFNEPMDEPVALRDW